MIPRMINDVQEKKHNLNKSTAIIRFEINFWFHIKIDTKILRFQTCASIYLQEIYHREVSI